MDQIGTMVAEAIARRAKAAIEQQARNAQNAQSAQGSARSPQAQGLAALQRRAQYGDKTAQSILARLQTAGLAPAPAPPPVAAVVPAPPAPVPAQAAPALADVAPGADGFELATLPGLPTKILEGMSLERPMLLTGFSGDGLLPAIVFAEALAKPVALREGGPGSSF